MNFLLITLVISLSYFTIGDSVVDFKEKWGYVNVRKDAHMFWWLYYADQDNYANRPLVIWIQGGPSVSGTGLGNFLEIGPLDEDLNSRNSTWLTRANLLFLDNPVGTGFSYVTVKSALARNNTQIAKDLVVALYSILEKIPEFQKSPLYIFSESYGGKMTVDFSLHLSTVIKSKNITCDLKAIALGDSWISPLDHVSSWSDYYYAMYTNNADWFNVLKNEGPYDVGCTHCSRIGDNLFDKLHDLMNGPIRHKLGDIPENVTWKHKSPDVFEALSDDFMKDVLASVDRLLIREIQIDVNVYIGQLDPIVNILGTLKWINRLKWPGLNGFQSASKEPIAFPGNRTGGFLKSYKQLHFFWILKAGHYVSTLDF